MKASVRHLLFIGILVFTMTSLKAASKPGSGNDPDPGSRIKRMVISYLGNHGYHSVIITTGLTENGDVIVFSDRGHHTIVHTRFKRVSITGHEDLPNAADIIGHQDVLNITGHEDLPQITGFEDLPY